MLYGTNCVTDCDDGFWAKYDDVKGYWCKKCPDNCKTCKSDQECTTCADYYSVKGVCRRCELGDMCLACNFEKNTCTKCVLGYRPVENSCLLIEEKCGDGLVSLKEACDDGNLANDDGCSR